MFTVPFLIAMLLGLLIPVVLWLLSQSVVSGVGLVIAAFLLELVLIAVPGIRIGIAIYPQDLVFSLLALAALFRMLRMPGWDSIDKAWLILGLIWFASLLGGLALYKTAAGLDFRPFFYFWAGVQYLLSFRLGPAQQLRLENLIFAAALMALLVVTYRWIADAAGFGDPLWREAAETARFRVVNASQSLFLAMSFTIGVSAWMHRAGKGYWLAVTPLLLFAIVLLQHRTVWVAVLAAVVTLVAVGSNSRRKLGTALLLTAIGGALIAVPFFLSDVGSGASQALTHSVQEPLGRTSTLAWRFESWKELLNQWLAAGPMVWPFGKLFGSGYTRYLEAANAQTTVSPHSFYVSVLLRGGIIGLAAMLGAFGVAFVRALRGLAADPDQQARMRLAATLLAAQAVYLITYGPHFVASVFVGLALSLLRPGPAHDSSRGRLPLNTPRPPYAPYRSAADLP